MTHNETVLKKQVTRLSHLQFLGFTILSPLKIAELGNEVNDFISFKR